VNALNKEKLVRKTFAIALEDLEILNQKFDSQFELSDYLRLKIEEAYVSEKFVVTYRMPKSMYVEPRTQRSLFLAKNTLQKYNEYVKETFGIDSQKKVENKVSQIFTSLAHDLAQNL